MATHSSILAWEIPRAEEPGGLQSMGLQSVGRDSATEHTGTRVAVHSLSHVRLSATPWTAARQAALSFRISNSCALSRRCHPIISCSVVPVSSCLQTFPASGSFPMSQLFASGGQSTGASASASVLPTNSQG